VGLLDVEDVDEADVLELLDVSKPVGFVPCPPKKEEYQLNRTLELIPPDTRKSSPKGHFAQARMMPRAGLTAD
jgi:hypothetical protein